MLRCAAIPMLALAFALGCENTATDPVMPAEQEPRFAATAAAALSFRQVSAGTNHTCGVTTDNRAYCWGGNDFGMLGDGTTIPRLTPVAVAGGLSFRHVTTGGIHTCGLTTDNRAYCWGFGLDGQLGDGNRTYTQLTPVPVAGGLRFVQISAADYGNHTCAVRKLLVLGKTAYRVYCWGQNFQGQLGDGTTTGRLTPTRVAGGLGFSQVSAGGEHTCALAAGTYRAYCWGWGYALGNGTTTKRVKPVPVATAVAFQQISAGSGHSCGLVRDRTQRVLCWGANQGRLGDGTTTNRLTPVTVAGKFRFLQISAGGTGTCGVTSSLNHVYCWGRNVVGEVGDGTTTPRLTPVAVLGGLRFTGLDLGTNHTCGLAGTNRAYCWGGNQGKLGDGTTTNRLTPVPVGGRT